MTFTDNSEQAKQLLNEATIRWLFQACILVEGQAALLAPVQFGWLRESIDYVVDERELKGYVGSPLEYAVYLEFGTGEFAENGRGRKGGWIYKAPNGEFFFTWGQDPQPYLRPAFRNTREDVEDLGKRIFGDIK